MGWYIVIKTIKGYRYRYRQRTWREGKHVRTESVYLGPADGAAPRPAASASAANAGLSQYERTMQEHRALLKSAKPRPQEPEKPEPQHEYTASEKREVQREERERAREYKKAMQKENAKFRAAKRDSKGIKALNPFLARGIKKKT